MAWTSGFFNSINGDRKHTADEISKMFEGLITSGVYETVGKKMAVQPNSGLTVQINTGRGYFAGRWANNDAPYLITVDAPDVTLSRYCAVCVRADDNTNARTAEPYLKYSDFATDPVKPRMERSELVNEFCLAYIKIRPNATVITAADIEDTRSDTNLCGWVTGLIKQVSTDTLFEQWTAAANEYFESLDEMAAHMQSVIDGIIAGSETMLKSQYDTNDDGKVDYAGNGFIVYLQKGDVLTGKGNYGAFKATASGEFSSFTIDGCKFPVVCGEDNTIELVAGAWYTFIKDVDGLNFKPGGAATNFDIIGGAAYPNSKGKNLIVYPYFHTTQTVNGLTFTDNGDGSITVSGRATALTHFRMSENTAASGRLYLPPGTYTLSGCPVVNSSSDGFMLEAWDAENNEQIAYDIGYGALFTLTKTTAVRVAIVVQSYASYMSNKVFWPQIEVGETKTAYEKYKQKQNIIWVETDGDAQKIKNFDFNADQPYFRSNNKNLLCYPFYNENGYKSAGITYTDNGDGSITANGTSTGTSIFRVSYGWERGTNCTYLTAGTYTLSGCPAGGADGTKYVVELYKVNPDETGNERFAVDTGSGVTFTLENDALVRCSIVVYSGYTASNLKFKPQLEKSSAATDFVKGSAIGQLWIETGAKSVAEFNALKKAGVNVYPLHCRVWDGNAWTTHQAHIYKNDKWVSLAQAYLSSKGFNKGVTGANTLGALNGDTNYVYLSVGPNYIIVNMANISNNNKVYGLFYLKEKVDLTHINTLKFTVYVDNLDLTDNGTIARFGIASTAPDAAVDGPEFISYKDIAADMENKQVIVSLDVSNINTDVYICGWFTVQKNGGDCVLDITNIEGE